MKKTITALTFTLLVTSQAIYAESPATMPLPTVPTFNMQDGKWSTQYFYSQDHGAMLDMSTSVDLQTLMVLTDTSNWDIWAVQENIHHAGLKDAVLDANKTPNIPAPVISYKAVKLEKNDAILADIAKIATQLPATWSPISNSELCDAGDVSIAHLQQKHMIVSLCGKNAKIPSTDPVMVSLSQKLAAMNQQVGSNGIPAQYSAETIPEQPPKTKPVSGKKPETNQLPIIGKPAPAKPVKPVPAKPEPVKPVPAKPEPIKPVPAKPEPVKPVPKAN